MKPHLRLITALAAFCALILPGMSRAANPAGQGESFVLRAGTVLPVADERPWRIDDGVVVVRDGRIAEVGAFGDVELPDDLSVIHMPDATVMPGLINASTSLVGNHSEDRSIGAGYRAVDAFNRFGNFRETLATGVTTVHLNPGNHRLVSGQGAVVRLGGASKHRVLLEEADVNVTLGESSLRPPDIQEQLVPPASDQAIEPQQPQRPTTRISQRLALKEALEEALRDEQGEAFDLHATALREAWQARRPLRVAADRAVDLGSAVTFLTSQQRSGYLVGGAEAATIADRIADAGLPLVYTVPASFRNVASDIGNDPDALDPDISDIAALEKLELALATRSDQPAGDLRLAAAMAQRAGVDRRRIIEAVTAVPAKILGVDDRVGSLAPGRDADLLVMTGDPLATSSHVQRVYVRGRVAYRAGGKHNTTVVRGGTIWLGPDEYLEDGSILIEDGRIVEVGRRVAHPPHARVVNVVPDAFITPGLIDSRGHLGLNGDTSSPGAQHSLARLIGAPDRAARRVAQAGVTTVMMTPYRQSGQGSRVAAVRTMGDGRADRVIRETAAVSFDLGSMDPASVSDRLKPRIDAAKQYLEAWREYERELEEWKKNRDSESAEAEAEEKAEEEQKEEDDDEVVVSDSDPLSGIWEGRIFGGPVREPVTGRVAINLTGDSFRGEVIELPQPVDHEIIGTLEGDRVTGRIDVDTGGMGTPTFEGTLTEEDRATGTITLAGMDVNFEMTRIEKDVNVQVLTRRRGGRDDDGRPVAPDVNETLEPLRAVLEERIPIIIEADTAAQIKAALDTIESYEDFDIAVVLADTDDALVHADRLRDSAVDVILPADAVEERDRELHHQSIDYARSGIRFGFQSGAEDGARSLPQLGLFAVERGLSPERALSALTIDAARIYGLDDRIGRIAPGRDADLVIFSGYPFDADTSVQRVIVNGEDLLP